MALFRVDLFLVALLDWFDTLVLVLLSDVADFVTCLDLVRFFLSVRVSVLEYFLSLLGNQ